MNGRSMDGDLVRKMSDYRSRERVYVAAVIEQEAELYRLRRATSDTLGGCGDVAKAALQNALYDPASNMEVLLLRQKIRERDGQISDLRQELEANSFDQQAPAGQALMKKCRLLLEENRELGEQIREDRVLQLRAVLLEEQRINAAIVDRVRESADFCKVLADENDKLQGSVSRVAGKLRESRAELEQVKAERGEAKRKRKQQRDAALAAAAAGTLLPQQGSSPPTIPMSAPVVEAVPQDGTLCISDSPTFVAEPEQHKKAKKAKKESSSKHKEKDPDVASQALQAAEQLAIAKDFFKGSDSPP